VTLSTSLRDLHPYFWQELARAFIGKTLLGMRIMTIGTDRRICVTRGQLILVYAIERCLVLIGVTVLAGGIKLQPKIARAAGGHFGVWEVCDVGVAIHTGNIFLPVDRGFEGLRVDRDRKRLISDLGGHPLLLMTSETRLIGRLFPLIVRRSLRRRYREDHHD
jgi:hypothetical protein